MWNSRNISSEWLPLYLNLIAVIVPFAFIAPLSCAFFCGFLLFLSALLRIKHWTIPLFVSLPILIFALMSLKLSLQYSSLTYHYSPIFTTTALGCAACIWSMRLRRYSHGQIFLLLIIACAGAQLLIDNSDVMLLWEIGVIIFTILNFLRLNLKEFSAVALLSSLKSAAQVALYVIPLLSFIIFAFLKFSHVHIRRNGEGSTGITSELRPGEISRLSQNDSIAFRAFLNRSENPFNDFYWRGFVLEKEEKSFLWKRQLDVKSEEESSHKIIKFAARNGQLHGHLFDDDGCYIHQKIFTQRNEVSDFSYALDRPLYITKSDDGGYEVTSNICIHDFSILTSERKKLLTTVGSDVSPRIRALAHRLWSESHGVEDYENQIFRYYVKNHFKYSQGPWAQGSALNPARMRSLDTFLFETRVGFCEHFAASFATLLRLVGIPSRIVVGFVGGEYNPFGHYWYISMKEAHAWVEVYEPKRGWVRVDPTAIMTGPPTERALSGPQHIFRLLSDAIKFERLRLLADAAFFQVTLFFKNKRTLFSLDDLKLDPWLFAVLLGFLLVLQYSRRRKIPDAVMIQNQFAKLCRLFGEKGIPKARAEGFESYRKRVIQWLKASSWARHEDTINSVFEDVILFKYGEKKWAAFELKKLKKRLFYLRWILRAPFKSGS